MGRWRTGGGLDDPVVDDGDRGFVGINARLEGDQLGGGYLAVSENGRIDRGSWQPRRAIESVSGALELAGAPLRLPFFIVETSGGLTVSSAARVDDVVTLTFASHPFTVGLTGYLGIESLTGSVSPNGVQFVTIASSTTITFSISGASGSETYSGTGKVRSVLDSAAAAEILASCLFSDPSNESAESVVVAANGQAFIVSVETGAKTDLAYPTGLTLSGDCELLQCFDRVLLFRKGGQPWVWHPQGRSVSAAVLASNVVTVTLKNHGLTTGDSVVLASIGYVTTNPNGTRVVTGVLTDDTFTFALTGANETFTANTGTATAGFVKARAGAYTQPQVFEVDSSNADVADGLATFTVSGNTTIFEGDRITIFDATDEHFSGFVGRSFTVTAASATAISFYIPVADHDGSGHSEYVTIGKLVSSGAGFMHSPGAPWGVYHQRRLWVPFWYSQTGTTASPTFADREIRDEIAASDILDSDTFDQITNQFRVTAGIADFTVAMQPFYEDALIVMNRNSLHLISGVSGSLADTTVNELTREIGCLARKSLAIHGSEIMFLSDSGVYQISFLDQYNLRGVGLPLSDAIQPIIDRINASLAGAAVGVYFNNRYYLAVPLDSAQGLGDATGNNAILVYNFLNQAWESVDSVADSNWNVLNFHIARSGARNDLYAVNTVGGLHKIDSLDSDIDVVAVTPGGSESSLRVSSRMDTRQFTFGTLDRKRFSELQIRLESSSSLASDGAIYFATEDPDTDEPVITVSDTLSESLPPGESASIRTRVGGVRGHGGTISFRASSGRPKVREVLVRGTETNRNVTNQT